MNINIFRGIALIAALTLAAGVASAQFGNTKDRRTVVTISGPVEIPGNKVLPGGTYVFRLLDSTGTKNVVQVFNRDETDLLATLLAVTDYRDAPTDQTIITFSERPAGQPEALHYWFFPGDTVGLQFVYPHTRADSLARESHSNVLCMTDEMTTHMTSGAKSANDPSVQNLESTDVKAMNPSGQEVQKEQAMKPKKQQ
jgi:hypothetical protein